MNSPFSNKKKGGDVKDKTMRFSNKKKGGDVKDKTMRFFPSRSAT